MNVQSKRIKNNQQATGQLSTICQLVGVIPGLVGPAGRDGVTPHIGENGNWWIGEEDTGTKAGGSISKEEIEKVLAETGVNVTHLVQNEGDELVLNSGNAIR